jgi:hypothetical protein
MHAILTFMKFLFRASQSIEAQSLKDLLEADGIGCTLRNETAAFFGEGLIHSEGMPEIWVEDDLFQQALDVKEDWTRQKSVATVR